MEKLQFKVYLKELEDCLQKQPVQSCFVKKMFLEILQNSQENTCARVSHLRWLLLIIIKRLKDLVIKFFFVG